MIDKFGIDELGRPCRDLYVMNLCFEAARKSIDPDTQHGCIATDQYGGILATGYNSAPQGFNDAKFPTTRPDKYTDMVHSEINCICIANRHGTSLEGSTFYITGIPCRKCMHGILQVKAAQIIYGPLNSVMIDNEEFLDGIRFLLEGSSIIIRRFFFDEGLYRFNPRVGEMMKNRQTSDVNFEWNWSGTGSSS